MDEKIKYSINLLNLLVYTYLKWILDGSASRLSANWKFKQI